MHTVVQVYHTRCVELQNKLSNGTQHLNKRKGTCSQANRCREVLKRISSTCPAPPQSNKRDHSEECGCHRNNAGRLWHRCKYQPTVVHPPHETEGFGDFPIRGYHYRGCCQFCAREHKTDIRVAGLHRCEVPTYSVGIEGTVARQSAEQRRGFRIHVKSCFYNVTRKLKWVKLVFYSKIC